MARKSVWQDDYWLLLMQIYLHRPVGVKPLYNREMVNLSLELHITPEALQERMRQIAELQTPRIERIWNTYSKSPSKLSRAVSLLRKMKGFGAAGQFFDGVEVQETFERDFRPLEEDSRFIPAMLIMVLNLYFQLTPSTMVTDTPEVGELARLLKLKRSDIVMLLQLYQYCDPYLNRRETIFSPLLLPCQQVWQRFANNDQLPLLAKELTAYFK